MLKRLLDKKSEVRSRKSEETPTTTTSCAQVVLAFCLVLVPPLLVGVSVAAAADTARPLFNGKNMEGWEHVGPGSFTVEGGVLSSHGGMGLLWYTREKIGNCVLRVVYKTSKADTNSGVFIRIEDRPKDEWFAVHHGYEVQIDDSGDEWHRTGAIYSISKATAKPSKPVGEWNVLEITLSGPRTVVSLNGVRVNDFKEGQPVPERKQWYEPERRPRVDVGYIGVQNHDANSSVYFREVSVLKLNH